MAKDEIKAGKAVAKEDDGLIKVAKDGETLAVNPACLAAHVALGWKEVQE